MSLAFAGLGLGAKIVEAEAIRQESKAQARAEEFNAQVAQGEIKISRATRKLAKGREKDKLKSFVAEQEALYAKAGVTLSGSPITVIEETIAQAELDIIIGDINAKIEQSRLESEVARRELSAEQIRRTGKTKALLTIIDGATTFGGKLIPADGGSGGGKGK